MNSGQVVMTSAVGAGDGTDKMVYHVRELRNSDEFNQNTIAQKGQLIAPELSISGKIIQRDVRYERGKTQVEYYFQLKVTNIANGLRFWQKEEFIGKRGSSKSVSW
jgi:PBP1b-binding outer membrane lipoprotein LpoB